MIVIPKSIFKKSVKGNQIVYWRLGEGVVLTCVELVSAWCVIMIC